jgi:hypothetical protein
LAAIDSGGSDDGDSKSDSRGGGAAMTAVIDQVKVGVWKRWRGDVGRSIFELVPPHTTR